MSIFVYLLRNIPGYASLPACSFGERRIYRNQTWIRVASGSGATDSDQYVFLRDCTLEAMRTQGAFSSFQGVAHCDINYSVENKQDYSRSEANPVQIL